MVPCSGNGTLNDVVINGWCLGASDRVPFDCFACILILLNSCQPGTGLLSIRNCITLRAGAKMENLQKNLTYSFYVNVSENTLTLCFGLPVRGASVLHVIRSTRMAESFMALLNCQHSP